ncbi:MAG: retropepsin-like aspartic protease [Steroidobacteraceae bacterium]
MSLALMAGVQITAADDCANSEGECAAAELASPTKRDRVGRVALPVWVDGKGPFLFIVDTGASRSTLSPQLVEKLGLEPSITPGVWLSGVTGSAQVPTVSVRELRSAQLIVPGGELPVVWSEMMANADGILGVAGLKRHRIEVDFQHNRVSISSASGGSGRGFLRVPARLVRGGLLVVDVKVGEVSAAAVIDTGAERSLGNMALLKAVQAKRRTEPGHLETTVLGATENIAKGRAEMAPSISLGDTKINRLPLTYGDFHIFQVWEMTDKPALILGMDVLGTLQGFVLDYRAREFLVRT